MKSFVERSARGCRHDAEQPGSIDADAAVDRENPLAATASVIPASRRTVIPYLARIATLAIPEATHMVTGACFREIRSDVSCINRCPSMTAYIARSRVGYHSAKRACCNYTLSRCHDQRPRRYADTVTRGHRMTTQSVNGESVTIR